MVDMTPTEAKLMVVNQIKITNKAIKKFRKNISWLAKNGHGEGVIENLYTSNFSNETIKQAITILRSEGWNLWSNGATISIDLLHPYKCE